MPRVERRQTSRTVRHWQEGGGLVNGSDLITEHRASATDAEPEPYSTWDSVPWEKAETHVSKLQTRIARATKEGRVEDARKAQRQLVASFDAKLLAVRTVTTNKGRNTPGVDGVLWKTPQDKLAAARALTPKGYRAGPLRRVRIPKKGKRGETRPLGIPTMRDRAMQALYALSLDPVAETKADAHSFGFRRGRSAQDASQRLFNVLGRKTSARYVLEGDIKGCFDHISHDWLMNHVPMDKRVLAQFLKAGFMEQGEWHETDEGAPQGGIISPILANMALDGMEGMLNERFMHGKCGRRNPKKASANLVHLVRYADDFVVTAKTPEVAAEARTLVEGFLAERGLELSEEKTLVTHIDEGFDFLGWNFRKYGGKLLVKPSKKAVDSFVREMHRCILREGRGLSQEKLVKLLTPKIRGFAAYHRHTCASRLFAEIDHIIYRQLQRWACRRHPRKTKGWVHNRYWFEKGGSKYVFGSEDCFLPHMAWQHIVRHMFPREDANPYLDRDYFAERKVLIRSINGRSFWIPAAKER